MDKGEGKTMSEWLDRVNSEQNLRKLGDLEGALVGREGNRFFASQEVKPVVSVAEYSPAQGKYLFCNRAVTTDTDVVSHATTTWTIPAGHAWKIGHIYARNNTTATYYTFVYTPTVGDAVTLNCGAAADLYAISSTAHFVGTAATWATAGGYPPLPPDMTFGPGTLVITDNGFAVADDVERGIFYTEV